MSYALIITLLTRSGDQYVDHDHDHAYAVA
jgi:hypothetical protein